LAIEIRRSDAEEGQICNCEGKLQEDEEPDDAGESPLAREEAAGHGDARLKLSEIAQES
jgi:hypothetical protein